jgi:hypothetical protein
VGYQVGAVFTINGEVVGMDAFGRPETFSKVFTKLVQSYALDAIDWFEPDKKETTPKDEAMGFIKEGIAAEVETHSSVGSGIDCRLSSGKITGFALCLDGKVLHLSIFARLDRDAQDHSMSRITRFLSRPNLFCLSNPGVNSR